MKKHLSFMFLTISSATGTGLLVEGTEESPDFRFPEVGISKVATHELRFNCIINLLLWHFFL